MESSEGHRAHLQAFLAVGAVANLGVGVAERAGLLPDHDPFLPRVALAGACLLGLAVGRVRGEWLSAAAMAAMVAMHLWFLHLTHLNGPTFLRVLVIAFLLVGSVLLDRARDALLLGGLATGGMLWAYAGPVTPEVPLWTAMGIVAAAGSGSAVVVNFRNRLTREIVQQREHAALLAAEVGRRAAAEEAALQASRAKSTFLANMSHELRTPLNAIIGYTELVGESVDDALRADLERVLVSSRHLLRLIDEVLDLARIEAGRFEMSPETVEVSPLLDECLGVVGPAAEAARIALTADAPAGITVFADRVRTKQILINLLSNAVKFTREGGVTVAVAAEGDRVAIRVIDTGIGVSADDLPHIFEAFEQVRGVDNPTGTGLGLAIGRELAERMGGTLTATSSLGIGSRFELGLPAGRGGEGTTGGGP